MISTKVRVYFIFNSLNCNPNFFYRQNPPYILIYLTSVYGCIASVCDVPPDGGQTMAASNVRRRVSHSLTSLRNKPTVTSYQLSSVDGDHYWDLVHESALYSFPISWIKVIFNSWSIKHTYGCKLFFPSVNFRFLTFKTSFFKLPRLI